VFLPPSAAHPFAGAVPCAVDLRARLRRPRGVERNENADLANRIARSGWTASSAPRRPIRRPAAGPEPIASLNRRALQPWPPRPRHSNPYPTGRVDTLKTWCGSIGRRGSSRAARSAMGPSSSGHAH
jgi:hypothetical protein